MNDENIYCANGLQLRELPSITQSFFDGDAIYIAHTQTASLKLYSFKGGSQSRASNTSKMVRTYSPFLFNTICSMGVTSRAL